MTAGTATQTFTYDNFGNILSANGNSYEYTDSQWKDKLMKFNGVELMYDESGNPLFYFNGNPWFFQWGEGRKLMCAEGENDTITYQYDSNSIRTSKTVNGEQHSYIYAGGKLIRETYGNTTIDFLYDQSGRPYAMSYNGTMYYYILNLQGDVVRIVNGSGINIAAYTYDAWGNVEVSPSTSVVGKANPLRYRGYYYDTESGFYYLQSRYYDPQIGRFINADTYVSTGQGFLGYNMFAYCLNNPVCYADDSGSAAKINFDHSMNVEQSPWREDSPGGGGYVYQGNRRGSSDYGAVEDKFFSVLFLKWLGNATESMLDAYLQQEYAASEALIAEMQMTHDFIADRFSTPKKTINTLDALKVPLTLGAAYCGKVGWVNAAFWLGVSVGVLEGITVSIAICNEEDYQ